MLCVLIVRVFFFNQKTAYEMRISDWSSDVCSSDLAVNVRASGSRLTSSGVPEPTGLNARFGTDYEAVMAQAAVNVFARLGGRFTQEIRVSADVANARSEERRVGKTCVSKFRSRWSTYH